MSERSSLEVLVKWNDKEFRFSGSVDEVISSILRLIGEVYPTFELVRSLTLTVDAEEMLKQAQGIFALTPEGLVILVAKGPLSDKEAICLHLVKQYIAYLFGKAEKAVLSVKGLSEAIKRPEASVSARAAELVNEWLAERADKGEFKVTPAGVKWFIQSIIPKLKAKETS